MNLDFTRNPTDVIVKIGERTFTSKDCILTSMEINISDPEPVYLIGNREPVYLTGNRESIIPSTLNLEFRFINWEIIDGIFDKKDENYIKNKIVDDCSIEELLHAIQIKLNKE